MNPELVPFGRNVSALDLDSEKCVVLLMEVNVAIHGPNALECNWIIISVGMYHK